MPAGRNRDLEAHQAPPQEAGNQPCRTALHARQARRGAPARAPAPAPAVRGVRARPAHDAPGRAGARRAADAALSPRERARTRGPAAAARDPAGTRRDGAILRIGGSVAVGGAGAAPAAAQGGGMHASAARGAALRRRVAGWLGEISRRKPRGARAPRGASRATLTLVFTSEPRPSREKKSAD